MKSYASIFTNNYSKAETICSSHYLVTREQKLETKHSRTAFAQAFYAVSFR